MPFQNKKKTPLLAPPVSAKVLDGVLLTKAELGFIDVSGLTETCGSSSLGFDQGTPSLNEIHLKVGPSNRADEVRDGLGGMIGLVHSILG